MKGPRYTLWLLKVRWHRWRAAFMAFICVSLSALVAYGSWRKEGIQGDGRSHIEIHGELAYLTAERLMDWVGGLGTPPETGWSPRELAESLGRHPWVRRASVKTLPGSKISVWIEESSPIALVLLDKLYYLSEMGGAFEEVRTAEEVSFPVLSGVPPEEWSRVRGGQSEVTAQLARFLMDWNREPQLSGLAISEMKWNESAGWVAYLTRPQVQVIFGNRLGKGPIYRFARLWGAVLRQGRTPTRIDLDYSDRAVVKWRG